MTKFRFFPLSRLLHLQFGTDRSDRGAVHGCKRHVRGEQTTTTRGYLVPSFRLPGVLGDRDKRTYQRAATTHATTSILDVFF